MKSYSISSISSILFILLLIGLFLFTYKSFNEGYSSIIPINCKNNDRNVLRYDCR